MVLVIDNYDSFTFNLVQYLGELGAHIRVLRNDQASVDEIAATRPDHIVISPGPGRPEEAGVTMGVIERLGERTPILGVCLGHQAIGAVFGGIVEHDGRGVFAGIGGPFAASRYHSLVVAGENLPPDLEVAARTREDGIVMALRHRRWPLHGVQFHPESILTGEGRTILRNFLKNGARTVLPEAAPVTSFPETRS